MSDVNGPLCCCAASQPLAGMLVSVPGHAIQLIWPIGSSAVWLGFVQAMVAGWLIHAPHRFPVDLQASRGGRIGVVDGDLDGSGERLVAGSVDQRRLDLVRTVGERARVEAELVASSSPDTARAA